MKTGTKILIGTGVAAGVAGIGYAVYKSRKKASDRGPDASVETSSISVGPSVEVMAPGVRVAEPQGWLSAVIMHGGLCTKFAIEYMTSKKYGDHWHLLPQLHADPKQSPRDPDLQWGTKTLMVNRFAEWPSPVFPRCAPLFTSPMSGMVNAGGSAGQWLDGITAGPSSALANLWPSYTRERAMRVAQRNGGTFDRLYGVMPGGIFVASDNVKTLRLPVYPAKRVTDWISWASGNSHLVHDKGLGMAGTAILSVAGADAMKRPLIVPEYYRQTTSRLYDWCQRISKWYATAQWLVWAGEMMRLHCPGLRMVGAPSWWRVHCAAWAIGVPTASQQRERMVFSDDTGNSESDLKTKLTPDETYDILKLIIKYTPVPGTKGASGEQIAAKGQARHLCDMPDSLGSLLPPIELVSEANADGFPNHWWSPWACSYWMSRKSTFNWATDVVMPIVNAVSSIGGGAASGAMKVAVTTATTVVQQIAYRVASFALQAVFKMSRGDVPFNSGDVVGLIGDAIDMSGLSDSFELKGIPQDTWESLKTFGAEIKKIPGVDWAQMRSQLEWVQSNLNNIRNIDKWNYIDQGFGGVGLSGRVKEAALDTLSKVNLAR